MHTGPGRIFYKTGFGGNFMLLQPLSRISPFNIPTRSGTIHQIRKEMISKWLMMPIKLTIAGN